MTRKQRRLSLIGIAGAVLVCAAGLVLYAMSDRIIFFNSPSDLASKPEPPGTRIRLGGLVAVGSVHKGDNGSVTFEVTDGSASVPVSYHGILPDLFSEGQGVVAEGVVASNGVFAADTVLAKHDERYMPKEVVEALKAQGVWEETSSPATASR